MKTRTSKQRQKGINSLGRTVVGALGVLSYASIIIASIMPLSMLSALLLVSTGSIDIEITMVPSTSPSSWVHWVDGITVLQVMLALIAVAVVGAVIVWVIARIPPAVLRRMSQFTHLFAAMLPGSKARNVLYAKLLLGVTPCAVMLGVYAFTWSSNVSLPLLLLSGIASAMALLFAGSQYALAHLISVNSPDIY